MDFLMNYVDVEDSHLEHHGVKGQKWGVRRFQNPDGTLTRAGRRRLNHEIGEKHTKYKRDASGEIMREHGWDRNRANKLDAKISKRIDSGNYDLADAIIDGNWKRLKNSTDRNLAKQWDEWERVLTKSRTDANARALVKLRQEYGEEAVREYGKTLTAKLKDKYYSL